MLELKDDFVLYHGSYCEVKAPDLAKGDKKADDFCISQLLPNKLKDQYCFKNDKGGGEPPFYICEYPSVFVEKSIVIRL